MANPKFYLTTPIYYVNDVPHIGHAYCTIAADVLARFKRMEGYDVFFLTGTDEHGTKIEQSAKSHGKTPKEWVDIVVGRFREAWQTLNISYDHLIRTTDDYHKQGVQKLFETIRANNYIYEGDYEGWYCVPDETFWTETQIVDGKCPDCGRAVERLKEKSYFFKLSAFADKLLEHIRIHPGFIEPETRRNEVLSRIRQGLNDLSISRTTVKWGIPVPGDPERTIYVWIDALINYITASGYGTDEGRFKTLWPADLHLIGKEILWFHTVIWPAMLMAANLPLPRRVFGHGWWTVEGQKMSKSIGNVVDPVELVETYGVDAVRYFLMREGTFGKDADFSLSAMIARINNELANDLGNLLSRALAMIKKYDGGSIPRAGGRESADAEILGMAAALPERVKTQLDNLQFNSALEEIWTFIRRCNKYVEENAPWELAKKAESKTRLNAVLYNLAESLRIIAVLLAPFMPATAEKMLSQLGLDKAEEGTFESARKWGLLQEGSKIAPGEPLFPRVKV
ncbi:MAG: methionine--tRNA ligase [Candidatus Abyssobacteria bacterium SURF_17]|jgi:methionyl-tRNA synthetase|uniref:Methionine--tRNA ligase n=1 Tax=Candidatus Abyssobacteria bacterium SURF_17 TaxID=2093361 RepID=A0A419F8A4_9BACT|nr:MAG: methionine--tRNA ligase [Candidatus Abyssubacteria bacterium SURF_17]